MSDAAVSVRHLTHRYGDRVAVDDLSLEINRAEIFGLLGPNGSGKSTLFKLLSTLVPAPVGTVFVGGIDAAMDVDAVRRRIGVVFQSPAVDKQLTAAENLRHHGHLYGLSGKELEKRIDFWLDRVGLAGRAGERIQSFSGGMRRRVELAKGLLTRPEVLFLDEPSTGLDPAARTDLMKSLRQVRADGVTVVLTTHLMEEADQCDRVGFLQAGRLVACDAPAALKRSVGGDVIVIESSQPVTLVERLRTGLGLDLQLIDGKLLAERPNAHREVPSIIDAGGGLISSISVRQPTLEDVFLRQTGKQFEASPTGVFESARV
jgi:ABC-2 type transport system ATP-binding protein